ncbi:hypothetical protein C8R43DRAFT_529545 [Mycena crocata]|nr:hypothetical protein C8R43DRAFT_529545 [Mycena crocata]
MSASEDASGGARGDFLDASEREKVQITDSPWILTHVNRRWRAIAISTPSLWSRIEIFRCLTEHASRWEEVSLRMTSSLVSLLAGLRNNIPVLRTLRIKWDGLRSQENVASIDCFETASTLVDVGIRNINRFVDVFLPTRHLTTYGLDAPHLSRAASMTLIGRKQKKSATCCASDDCLLRIRPF